MSARAMSDEQVRAMFEACMSRLNDYHFVQCTTHSHSARCTCGLHVIKSAIRDNFNAIQEAATAAATRATAERCARACEEEHDRIMACQKGDPSGDINTRLRLVAVAGAGACAALCWKVGEA